MQAPQPLAVCERVFGLGPRSPSLLCLALPLAIPLATPRHPRHRHHWASGPTTRRPPLCNSSHSTISHLRRACRRRCCCCIQAYETGSSREKRRAVIAQCECHVGTSMCTAPRHSPGWRAPGPLRPRPRLWARAYTNFSFIHPSLLRLPCSAIDGGKRGAVVPAACSDWASAAVAAALGAAATGQGHRRVQREGRKQRR